MIGQVGNFHSYKGIGLGSTLKGFANAVKVRRWSKLNFKASEFEKRVFQLANMVKNYEIIFKTRDFGGLIDKTDPKKERGSIPYLLIESHSTSRRVLHDEVRDFLKRLGPKR